MAWTPSFSGLPSYLKGYHLSQPSCWLSTWFPSCKPTLQPSWAHPRVHDLDLPTTHRVKNLAKNQRPCEIVPGISHTTGEPQLPPLVRTWVFWPLGNWLQ